MGALETMVDDKDTPFQPQSEPMPRTYDGLMYNPRAVNNSKNNEKFSVLPVPSIQKS